MSAKCNAQTRYLLLGHSSGLQPKLAARAGVRAPAGRTDACPCRGAGGGGRGALSRCWARGELLPTPTRGAAASGGGRGTRQERGALDGVGGHTELLRGEQVGAADQPRRCRLRPTSCSCCWSLSVAPPTRDGGLAPANPAATLTKSAAKGAAMAAGPSRRSGCRSLCGGTRSQCQISCTSKTDGSGGGGRGNGFTITCGDPAGGVDLACGGGGRRPQASPHGARAPPRRKHQRRQHGCRRGHTRELQAGCGNSCLTGHGLKFCPFCGRTWSLGFPAKPKKSTKKKKSRRLANVQPGLCLTTEVPNSEHLRFRGHRATFGDAHLAWRGPVGPNRPWPEGGVVGWPVRAAPGVVKNDWTP